MIERVQQLTWIDSSDMAFIIKEKNDIGAVSRGFEIYHFEEDTEFLDSICSKMV